MLLHRSPRLCDLLALAECTLARKRATHTYARCLPYFTRQPTQHRHCLPYFNTRANTPAPTHTHPCHSERCCRLSTAAAQPTGHRLTAGAAHTHAHQQRDSADPGQSWAEHAGKATQQRRSARTGAPQQQSKGQSPPAHTASPFTVTAGPACMHGGNSMQNAHTAGQHREYSNSSAHHTTVSNNHNNSCRGRTKQAGTTTDNLDIGTPATHTPQPAILCVHSASWRHAATVTTAAVQLQQDPGVFTHDQGLFVC